MLAQIIMQRALSASALSHLFWGSRNVSNRPPTRTHQASVKKKPSHRTRKIANEFTECITLKLYAAGVR